MYLFSLLAQAGMCFCCIHWIATVGCSSAINLEDTDERHRQVNSSLELSLRDDDDDATAKEVSDDGDSYAGTILRGGLRDDSE